MVLKFTNAEHTAATFGNSYFSMPSPDDWDSIGDGPTREAVKAWLNEGNAPEAYVEPVQPLPTIVTMRQARLALLQAGLLASVDAAIAAMPSPDKEAAKIEWEYSQEVHRNKPFVQQLGQALNLSTEQLDALFLQASTL